MRTEWRNSALLAPRKRIGVERACHSKPPRRATLVHVCVGGGPERLALEGPRGPRGGSRQAIAQTPPPAVGGRLLVRPRLRPCAIYSLWRAALSLLPCVLPYHPS